MEHFDEDGYLKISITPQPKLLLPPFEKMEGYPNLLVVGASFSSKSFVVSAFISRIKPEYRSEIFIRVNGADVNSSPVYEAFQKVYNIKFYPNVGAELLNDIKKEANNIPNKIFINIIDDPLKYFEGKSSHDIANFFTYSRHHGIINIMQIQFLSGITMMTLNQILKNCRVIAIFNQQPGGDLEKFEKKVISRKITKEIFNKVLEFGFKYERVFLVAITDALISDLFLYVNGKFVFNQSEPYTSKGFAHKGVPLPDRKKFNIIGDEEKDKSIQWMKSLKKPRGTSREAVLNTAHKFNIDLEALEDLGELVLPSTKINKWYLYSIGNVRGMDGINRGHWTLFKIVYETIEKKKTPIIYFFTSQALSNEAIKELEKFYKSYKISIIPVSEYAYQPIYSIFDAPDTSCGQFCLYFLKNKMKPTNLIPYQKFDYEDQSKSIAKGRKVPNAIRFNNEKQVLNSSVGKSLSNYDSGYMKEIKDRLKRLEKHRKT